MAMCPFFFSDFYRPMRIFDQHFAQTISTDDALLPTHNFFNKCYFRPWKLDAKQDFGSTIKAEKDKFQICLDVQQFKPEEIKVKTVNREIIIEGKHEERMDEHGFISRQFIRKYALPDNFDSTDVISNLTTDGVLMITFKKQILNGTEEKEKEIPVKIDCPKNATCKNDMAQNIKECTKDKDTIIIEDSKIMKKDDICFIKDEARILKDAKSIDQMCMKDIKNIGKDECILKDAKNLVKDELSISKDGKLKDEVCILKDTKIINIDEFKRDEKIFSRDDRCSLLNADGSLKFSTAIDATKAEKTDFSSFSTETTSMETLCKETSSFSSSSMSFDMKSTEKAINDIDIIATELKHAAENL